MTRKEELALIQRCIDHFNDKTTTLGDEESSSDVSRYLCDDQFAKEEALIFKSVPGAFVHVSELSEPNSFKRVKTNLGDLLFTRSEDGKANAFYNTCRHRGTTLVEEDSGCSKRLTCPYHAWSYSTKGALESVPAQSTCFPNINKSELGLVTLACVEKYGFIWVCPNATNENEAAVMLDEHLGDMAVVLDGLNMQSLNVFKSKPKYWQANWKILAEGGLETYHFSFAHKNTIGPFFENNSSVIDLIGNHARVIMPTKLVSIMEAKDECDRHLRDFTHTLYSTFPQSAFLVQEKHIDWVRTRPISADHTEMVVTSLIPNRPENLNADETAFWKRNFTITLTTLDEDFVLGESIQKSISSGAISTINYGRNEATLKRFNEVVDKHLEK